ncbi:MAG: CDP-glycerol glycerophosphotransferase family protein [Ligilactobacillus agilis]|uniref:CDP-glycerol glycerophosphotransferase family protein n=1 Tax=Ligilactobacillus agilis TaxID=1601 RepID=UPI00242FE730|nr:CDP-glycerol glycerophosphotransferase family protein [Ligilactobacillus agilis]MCI5761187.1 CDP-glycerol glycerophosphotransferase family protein [Ligilactobacillus agilis]
MNTRDSKEILNLITTLEEANEYLASSEEIDLELLKQVITNCLTASENISQTLQTFGEGISYQAELTTYQRLLQNFLANISQAGELAYPAQTIGECLAKLTAKLSAKHKKQVVFLPYKASMWDSLASIYEAASADPSCDAYVIPIPYFTKDEHGKLKSLHYEGDLFPKDVPITSWKDYPLAKMRPDIIYIHNSYDDGNLITTVLPAFYTDKLKQYTDLLVYVPYFVSLHECKFYNYALAKGIENTDVVFVQDEVDKAGYQGAWKKFAQENPTYPKESLEQVLAKMVALGNPKYDALNKTNPSNYPLPSEWKQKIYRLDGSKKIVVFYNTTIVDLNASGRQMLAKYADVFNFFLKHQADYTLLWRPHPLLIDAICSQHPDLLADYLQLVSQFKESQMGIYDDSPDFYLAYTYADAFYGDMSSMAELFRKLNRPVIKQIPTYPTEQVPAEFDLNLVKEHLAKQKCLAEGKLPLAKLPACLAANTHSQKTTDYHFGLDIHRYVMNLANK